MRRTCFAAALAGAAVLTPLLSVTTAWTDQQISAAPPNQYTTTSVTMAQGERLTFRNDDVVSHDVTSDLKGQFQTDLIGQGKTVFVEGSQYLTSGDYPFHCSVHDNMHGVLHVTTQGTPVPRPGTNSGPPADQTAPGIIVSAARKVTAKALAKTGKLKLSVQSDEGATLKLVVKFKTVKAASASSEIVSGTNTVTVRLAKKVRSKLRRGAVLKVSATAADTAGNVGSDGVSIKLG